MCLLQSATVAQGEKFFDIVEFCSNNAELPVEVVCQSEV